MTTTVQAILEGAYNRATDNDPGKLAQDPELILHLNRIYQQIWPLIARARPDAFQSETTAAFSGNPPLAAIPADTIAVLAAWEASGNPVNLIAAIDRARTWNLAPCIYRRGGWLVSRNQTGDPLAGAVLTLTLLDKPATLATLTDTLDPRWPIRHVQLLVDCLATYLATKDAGRDNSDRAALQVELGRDVSAFAADFGLAPEAVQWIQEPLERAVAGPSAEA